jgi:hypothetical protein
VRIEGVRDWREGDVPIKASRPHKAFAYQFEQGFEAEEGATPSGTAWVDAW